ncbi:MAG: hypothetical protein J1E37_00490 [Prevotella sp.]|nr:hypothetical protein [Prevotella sp.]
MREWGTFKDCLKAPIYRWFTYPAGFSFKAAIYSFNQEKLVDGSTVYDPFMGSGTTNLAAKTMGINSYGVEAHPFVFPITKCKLNWEINAKDVVKELDSLKNRVLEANKISDNEKKEIVDKEFPELVLKCFLPNTLFELLVIRNSIKTIEAEDVKLFLNTGLICCLREVSIAATGWPYIAPNKIKITSLSKDGIGSYINFIKRMVDDIQSTKSLFNDVLSEHNIFLGDSRDTKDIISNEVADHIFTSPPYLNNFDYADRTRLEMYFMGDANCWADICNSVRTKLITSATTQINRSDEKWQFTEDFIKDNPEEYAFLKGAVDKLGELRLTKGGKKSYDYLVLGYFNDLYKILKDNYRILKPHTTAKYILGDSAPYGVHIPTDELIAKIGCNIGFDRYKIDVLRTRGDKWKKNPQRHNVKLRESIVTLYKKN